MFGKSNDNANAKGKFKPYRNRPGKRQGLLELFSFLLVLVSVPAFLGGVFSIFVGIAAFCLGIIGLFAWTRRHAWLYTILAACVIAGAIISIILRATFHAQCMPFYQYSNQFSAVGGVVPIVGGNNNTGLVNGTSTNSTTPAVGGVTGNNGTNNGTAKRDEALTSTDGSDIDGNGAISPVVGNPVNNNSNSYDNSIWCGNNKVLYITNAIIILLALLGMLCALAALTHRNKTPVAARTTETAQSHTRTEVASAY